VTEPEIEQVAAFLRERNAIDEKIAKIISRPMTAGHLGEWLASKIFGIELEATAVAAAFDGRFTSGRLQGRTVNVKWYLKRESVLDLTESETLDYYLVFAGPASAAVSSRGSTRPWCIESVYLFDAKRLLNDLSARGIRIGTASSVRKTEWDAAEIYPRPNNPLITVEPQQVAVLRLLAPQARTGP
jgi:hypothetical protein